METNGEHHHADGIYYAKAYKDVPNIGYLLPQEIDIAVRLTKSLHEGKELRFEAVNHYEPSKEDLLGYGMLGQPVLRSAEVISSCFATGEIFIDYVFLFSNSPEFQTVRESRTLTDAQTGISPAEYALVEELCKNYEPLKTAIEEKGLDSAYIVADAWCLGYVGPEYDPTEKMCWPSLFYYDPRVDDLPYARPIEGIHMHISLTKKSIKAHNSLKIG